MVFFSISGNDIKAIIFRQGEIWEPVSVFIKNKLFHSGPVGIHSQVILPDWLPLKNTCHRVNIAAIHVTGLESVRATSLPPFHCGKYYIYFTATLCNIHQFFIIRTAVPVSVSG
jgi:hypothetical protein